MRGVNKVIIIGNVGQDPDLKTTASGTSICSISVATSESWKDKTTGQQQEKTEWHRIVFFNRLAEIAGEYLRKGSKVYVEGKLTTRKWQDNTGVDRYTTEIVASEMQMLDSRESTPQQQQAPTGTPRDMPGQAPQQRPVQQEQGMDSFEDDIPF